MYRHFSTYRITMIAAAMLMSMLTAQSTWAAQETIPFEEADIFIELNHTDGDLGLQSLIDGEDWKQLDIRGPGNRKLLDVNVLGRLRRQGLTEIFFESAEPSFDELAPEEFFKRFREGVYTIEGRTLEGDKLHSTAELSHVLAAPPGNVLISGIAAVENCDVTPLPVVDGTQPVILSWDPVTQSHPEIGETGTIEVEKYTLVLEREEPELLIFSVELPADVTQFEVPLDFIALGEEFKFEIQVKESSGNQTVVESCFEIEE